MKKGILLALALLLISVMLVSCGGGSKSAASKDNTLNLTWWISRGEDSTYYMSYEDNPGIKYIESLEFNGQKVKFDFFVPVSGSERDNFNTLLMTEEYAKVFDMSYCTQTPGELLEDGIIWDLTPYMEECMPHYLEIVNSNPSIRSSAYSNVNGEKKILTLYSMSSEVTGNFMGLSYRRDWVAKYGTNPKTGAPFTYGYTDPNDYNTYYDDVVFPSGGSDPVYVSDWEWMFGIFEKAMADLGIKDGYCISILYKGYAESGGGFDSAFGGGTPMWFKNQNGDCEFGGTSEAMRTYLEMMHAWYEKGWLDKSFAEHTSDQVYAIDSAKINSGKIGAFVGRRGNSGGQMDNDDKLTDGIMIYGARPAINDVYGSEAVKNHEPFSLYQYPLLRANLCVTTKATEEELKTILTMLDFFYTEPGAPILCFGLTKEESDSIDNPIYAKYGLTNGAYTRTVEADGSYRYDIDPILLKDNNLSTAMSASRITCGYFFDGFVPAMNRSYDLSARRCMAEWDHYLNTGYIDKSVKAQFTTDESAVFTKVYANVDTYMSQNIPKFITGSLDVKGTDWDNYCKMLNKYSPNKVTAIYQRVFDEAK